MVAKKSGKNKPKKKLTLLGFVRETLIVLVVAVAISALVKTFLIQSFYIPSLSMWDTLDKNDRIMVSKLVPKVRDLYRGDVIVFKDPDNWLGTHAQPQTKNWRYYLDQGLVAVGLEADKSNSYLVKRLIGLPGDHVQCCEAQGRLVVNGTPINEPYLLPGVSPSETAFDVTVPKGRLWVMGDNRPGSADSRAHVDSPSRGFVPIDDVVGRAFVVMWPIDHWRTLNNTDAFVKVPSPR